MLFPSMRPTFRREVDVPLRQVADEVNRALASTTSGIVGSVAGTVIELYPTRAKRHVFSPRLSVVLYPRSGTLIVGRYGPNPDIWTFFVALYALCFFATFAGGLGALIQRLAGEAPTFWVGVPVGLAGALLVYVAALIGRNAARDQVAELGRFFESCIEDTVSRAASGERVEHEPTHPGIRRIAID